MKCTVTKLVLLIFLSSCGSKNNLPQGILKKEKMQAVLWDVLRADAFTFQFITKDSTKKPEAEMAKLQQQVFAVHKTTREEFYKSYSYYKSHPDILQPMLDSMISRYTRDKYETTKGRQFKTDSLKVEK
jgi:Domain of unknown function (DUF4296)